MRIKKFSLNQLTIRTFTVFWLAFFAMTALLIALPYFDSRLYSDLNQNEISSYQKKLVNRFVTIESMVSSQAFLCFQLINLTQLAQSS